MTLVIALRGEDSIILASDSRRIDRKGLLHWQEQIPHDDCQKVWRLSNSMGLAITANEQGYASRLRELFRQQIPQQELNDSDIVGIIDKCALLANKHLREQIADQDQALILAMAYSRNVGVIFVGFDKAKVSHIGYLSTGEGGFLPAICDEPYLAGGISSIAKYIMEHVKREITRLSQPALKLLAAILIMETAAFEVQVGGPIQMLVIPKASDAYQVGEVEVAKIKEQAERLMALHNKQFIEMLERESTKTA